MPAPDDVLPDDVAARARGFCGAQVEHVVDEAGLLAVREAIASDPAPDAVRVTLRHFLAAIGAVGHSPR